MFETMHQIVGKLMSDERMADALADLAILRDETATIEAQWSARDAEMATMQDQHSAMMEQMKAEAAAAQEQFDSQLRAHLDAEAQMQEKMHGAVAAYKKITLTANPEIPAAMLDDLGSADTVEAIDATLEKARSLVEQIKANLGMPGGAPTRNRIDLASMSSLEKIRYAISQ